MSEDKDHSIYRLGFPYNLPKNHFTMANQTGSWFKPYIKHNPLARYMSDLAPPETKTQHAISDFKKYFYFPWMMNYDSNNINRTPQGIQEAQYEANNPTEDRLVIKQLNDKEGYLLGVFDGHGGGLLAQEGSKRIHNLFQMHYEALKKEYTDKKQAMKNALIEAFNSLEKGFFEKATEQLTEKKKYKKIGSCAICCVLTKQFVIVANAGDSKVILVSQENGQTIELNQMFNTNNQKQIQRIKNEHEDQDILVTNSKNGAKYLKGCLIPTRCFGDFHLKYEQFAEGVIKFNKKYITHSPDIRIHQFKNNTKYYLVAGSDGLWDELNDEEISKTILGTEDLNKADALIDAALDRVAQKNKVSAEKIRQISPKRKREYHDDISIIVANLEELN